MGAGVAISIGGRVGMTGEIVLFWGQYVPDGWLACDGSELQISSYQELFDVIGTTHGGDGISTFRLPNYGLVSPVELFIICYST